MATFDDGHRFGKIIEVTREIEAADWIASHFLEVHGLGVNRPLRTEQIGSGHLYAYSCKRSSKVLILFVGEVVFGFLTESRNDSWKAAFDFMQSTVEAGFPFMGESDDHIA